MKAFFDNPEQQARLAYQAGLWHRTPFIKGAAIKGAGVDCIHLVAEIYKACGVITDYSFPPYTLDGGRHLKRSLVLDWLAGCRRFVECATGDCKAGDLLCFRMQGVEHHVGILINGQQFTHSVQPHGVNLSLLVEPIWARRFTHVFRPMEVAR